MTAEWDAAMSWLHARLDAEARRARAAQPLNGRRWEAVTNGPFGPAVRVGDGDIGDDRPEWTRNVNTSMWHCDDEADGCPEVARGWIAEAQHIALHDPEGVLLRVESDRLLLEWMQRTYDIALDANLWTYDEWQPLKIMALRYVDAPDFPEVLRLDPAST